MLYMLCDLCYIPKMSRGTSGRIVLEVDRETKRELYAALAREGLTLKAWFLEQARGYVRGYGQRRLSFVAEAREPHGEESS
jgi:hypothetical protein